MKRENIVGVSLFILLLIAFGLWQKNKEDKKYKEKGVLTTGNVIKVKDDYKRRPYVYYIFSVGANTYTGKSSYPEFKANIEAELKNKSFPVIYIKNDPNDNQILISRAEFKSQGIPFPDSLAWTRKLEVP